MTNLSTAARAGRLSGNSYRAVREVLRMIEWREVLVIAWRCTVVLAVVTYALGEASGRWTHRANDRLAALWVSVLATTEESSAVAPEVLADQRCEVIPAQTVTVELARAMLAEGMSQRAVSRDLQVPRTTLRRMLARG